MGLSLLAFSLSWEVRSTGCLSAELVPIGTYSVSTARHIAIRAPTPPSFGVHPIANNRWLHYPCVYRVRMIEQPCSFIGVPKMLTPRPRLIFAFCVLGLLLPCVPNALGQFDADARWAPADTNVLVMIHSSRLFESSYAKKERAKEASKASFESGTSLITPDVDRIMVTSQFDFEVMLHALEWRRTLGGSRKFDLGEIANRTGATLEMLAGRRSVLLRRTTLIWFSYLLSRSGDATWKPPECHSLVEGCYIQRFQSTIEVPERSVIVCRQESRCHYRHGPFGYFG